MVSLDASWCSAGISCLVCPQFADICRTFAEGEADTNEPFIFSVGTIRTPSHPDLCVKSRQWKHSVPLLLNVRPRSGGVDKVWETAAGGWGGWGGVKKPEKCQLRFSFLRVLPRPRWMDANYPAQQCWGNNTLMTCRLLKSRRALRS